MIDVRNYERVYVMVRQAIAADKEETLPTSDLVTEVLDNVYADVHAEYQRKKAKQAARAAKGRVT